MRRMLSLAAVTALVWSATIMLAPAASAAIACTGTITTTVNNSVVVANGADCTIFGATVTGSLVVNPGGTLTLVGAQIGGSVSVNGAKNLRIGDCGEFGGCPGPKATVIKGSLSVTGTTDVPSFPTTNIICDGTQVGGSFRLANNKAAFGLGSAPGCFFSPGATVLGSAAITGNTAPVTLKDVNVVKTLGCFSNVPAPVNGGGNTAGLKAGQCAAF